jgi:hypothetical protein
MSQCIKYGIASALLDRIESGSFIEFLDRTEYGLVARMFKRTKYGTDIRLEKSEFTCIIVKENNAIVFRNISGCIV